MDLTSILNNPDERGREPRRVSDSQSTDSSAPPAHKRQPPPALSTPRNSSLAHGPPSFERHHSAVAYSPGPAFSASSQTPTPLSAGTGPGFPSPYHRNAPLPSPGSRAISTPTSYFAPGQRPASNHSLHRTSSSPFDHAQPYPLAQSPTAARRNSFHQGISPSQSHQPLTPLAPPPLPRGESSSQSLRDAGLLYDAHHRSPSGASLASPGRPPLHVHRSLSYSATEPSPAAHMALTNGSPEHRRSSGQSHGAQQRLQSLSVSPKTVVQALSPSQQRRQPSIDSASAPVPHPADSFERSTTPNHPPPAALVQSSSRSDAPSQPVVGVKRDTMTDSPQQSQPTVTGTKRAAADDVHPAPAKRPRKFKEPPIWARPKKGLRPLKVAGAVPPQNGEVKAEPPPALTRGTSIAERGYEPSITNIIPYEDMTRQVANFIFSRVIVAGEDVPFEIEAKLGVLCDPGTHDRISLPVSSEVIIDSGRVDASFESHMTEAHHRAMNKFLNQMLVESKRPAAGGQRAARVPVDYQHSREADSFYELPVDAQKALAMDLQANLRKNSWRFKPRVRVTRDQKTNQITAKIVKSRVADLQVYCPNSRFDWRISINLEQRWEGDADALTKAAEPDRLKDRLSYSHQWYRVDLTQVKSSDPAKRPSHELEVEMDIARLREQGRLALASDPSSKYEDFIKVFLDNVRSLARYNPPPV